MPISTINNMLPDSECSFAVRESVDTIIWFSKESNSSTEMKILTIIILHIGICVASHHPHTIPVEGYETELHDLGEHVEIPETPVKIIKITKTVAVKIPVPYPVKVVEKVPYPVHINKPYPVPVPQLVHAPYTPKRHEHLALGDGHSFQGNADNSYQVKENNEHNSPSYNGPAYSGHAPNSEDYAEESPNYTKHNNYYGSNGLESNTAIQQNHYGYNSPTEDVNNYY
ncbi:unnamed protein product [Pieris macdunnoughi]|uniref:Uncharacterized protein n=1 Tax=Pieris macdunnoughi TaxID=345717 RepID=A0A821M4D8_9NEOP|nr:unnamed protein product [Pieris macdunnoughi]